MTKSIALALLLSLSSRTLHAQATPDPDLSRRVAELSALVEKLQSRVTELEKKASANPPIPETAAPEPTPPPAPQPAPPRSGSSLLGGTTINFLFDGYYGYNFNNPIGRVNLLRAFDVSTNAFSLNQAGLVFENAPDAANGKRFGLRVDLQYGQATETLQGNGSNEPRPEIYRNIFQAYGTYVFPVGKGLTVDFGKFASSLGIEGNYSKDQLNYSRSYWFDYLPYYHMGVRASYKVSDALAVNYWITNGTQQTEPFNGFKDQFIGLTIQPRSNFTWNVNYYFGQEHPDVEYFPNGGAPQNAPTQQGSPFEPIVNPPKGKLHILDSYFNWQAAKRLTFALEGDYVIQRLFTNSAPSHTIGGAAYAQYQFTPKFSLGGRAEYLSDHGGLFTGITQAAKETTITTKYSVAEGLLLFGEWRRDFSNQPYFYTNQLGVLDKQQNTATMGLVWWFGGKQGVW